MPLAAVKNKQHALDQLVNKALGQPHLISGHDFRVAQKQGWSMQDILKAIKLGVEHHSPR
ncbi:MAG: hypothetical protein HOM11_04965 [Methylococcales bacterium]|jgi:hypothetical protein|nr:hypothetical protein [Methylococcales bacterium]MBT7443494.1 hypothetical protein [Methylococcales bacterium]